MPVPSVATLEATVEIAAPPGRVWDLVSDLRNMARWSPQTARTFVLGGPVGLGSRTLNVNRRGFLVWPTSAQVVRFEPYREIAWRVRENRTVWSYALEPTGMGSAAGTRLTARREAPQGLSDLSVRLTKAAFGSVETFSAELTAGMRETLQRIKADAEARAT